MHNFTNIQIIIMAGGVGSRFWPMSTPGYPKQLIDVMGVGRSLIQYLIKKVNKTINI
jgi:mannose-1-phosphate guanylyltransferase